MCLVAKGSYSVSNTQVVQLLLPHGKADFLVSNQRSTNGTLDLQIHDQTQAILLSVQALLALSPSYFELLPLTSLS